VVKRESPGVTQPYGVNLRPDTGLADERIVQGNVIWVGWGIGMDIDAQHFTEQARDILRIVERIAFVAAITQADVQVPVRSESHMSTIVISKRLIDLEDDFFTGRIDQIGPCVPGKSGNPRLCGPPNDLVEIDVPVLSKCGIKG
jgi:hypothetical protein